MEKENMKAEEALKKSALSFTIVTIKPTVILAGVLAAPVPQAWSRKGLWAPGPADSLSSRENHSTIVGQISSKESTCNARSICRRGRFDPWVGKIPARRKWQYTPVFLPGESHRRRSLVGYSPWDRKESDTTEQLNNSNNQWNKSLGSW